MEAARAGRVSRGVQHLHYQPCGLDFLAVPKHRCLPAVLGQCGAHRRTGQPVQGVDSRGVVPMAVGDQDQLHRFGGKGGQVAGIIRSGVHDDRVFGSRRAQDVGVGSLQRHRSGVGGEQEGCLPGNAVSLLPGHGTQSRATGRGRTGVTKCIS